MTLKKGSNLKTKFLKKIKKKVLILKQKFKKKENKI